jgi:hypothetical protein
MKHMLSSTEIVVYGSSLVFLHVLRVSIQLGNMVACCAGKGLFAIRRVGVETPILWGVENNEVENIDMRCPTCYPWRTTSMLIFQSSVAEVNALVLLLALQGMLIACLVADWHLWVQAATTLLGYQWMLLTRVGQDYLSVVHLATTECWVDIALNHVEQILPPTTELSCLRDTKLTVTKGSSYSSNVTPSQFQRLVWIV